jgi:hypothetical protein
MSGPTSLSGRRADTERRSSILVSTWARPRRNFVCHPHWQYRCRGAVAVEAKRLESPRPIADVKHEIARRDDESRSCRLQCGGLRAGRVSEVVTDSYLLAVAEHEVAEGESLRPRERRFSDGVHALGHDCRECHSSGHNLRGIVFAHDGVFVREIVCTLLQSLQAFMCSSTGASVRWP